MYKILRSFIIAVALLLTTVLIAQAGGWAVITLDELPTQITAGQALSIGFTVRQHGRTLRSDLKPIVRFDRADAKESFEVTAQREGAEGHYVAEIKFPSAGQWEWQVDIEQFGMITQPMPTLSVQVAPTQSRLLPSALILEVIRMISQMLPNKAATMTDSAQTMPLKGVAAKVIQDDQAARGKALFIAKGCVMCHQHAKVNPDKTTFWFGDTPAPDLTVNKFTADYLRSWLKEPAAIKPKTPMPNLNLKPEEIEVLVAFLQAAP